MLLSTIYQSVFHVPCVHLHIQFACSWFIPVWLSVPFFPRYGHGFEMFCLASDSSRTVVASACKVSVRRPKPKTMTQSGWLDLLQQSANTSEKIVSWHVNTNTHTPLGSGWALSQVVQTDTRLVALTYKCVCFLPFCGIKSLCFTLTLFLSTSTTFSPCVSPFFFSSLYLPFLPAALQNHVSFYFVLQYNHLSIHFCILFFPKYHRKKKSCF